MDNSRMATSDMLQYCKEALAWEDFAPVDIFFFESVRKIILGECSPFDAAEEFGEESATPVSDTELAFDEELFTEGFFETESDGNTCGNSENDNDSSCFIVNF